jgi:predicted nucleic acid-binding protein
VILVDTSVWVDYLRVGDELLQDLLNRESVLSHELIIGELALGSLRNRQVVLAQLLRLPEALMARHEEVMRLLEQQRLYGSGLSYVDLHVLAAARLTPDASLWTRDKALLSAAEKLSLAARVTH